MSAVAMATVLLGALLCVGAERSEATSERQREQALGGWATTAPRSLYGSSYTNYGWDAGPERVVSTGRVYDSGPRSYHYADQYPMERVETYQSYAPRREIAVETSPRREMLVEAAPSRSYQYADQYPRQYPVATYGSYAPVQTSQYRPVAPQYEYVSAPSNVRVESPRSFASPRQEVAVNAGPGRTFRAKKAKKSGCC